LEPGKKVEIHLPAVQGFEKVAMERAASVARKMGFSDDRIEDLKTAVAEACINAMEHGSEREASAKIGITLTVDESKLQVDVHDSGEGFRDVVNPNIDDKIEGSDGRRGWGVFLIKNLMDEVKFEAKPEGGNVVKMVVYLEQE
jgi:serine/threonine-protein kinase RsbW